MHRPSTKRGIEFDAQSGDVMSRIPAMLIAGAANRFFPIDVGVCGGTGGTARRGTPAEIFGESCDARGKDGAMKR